MPKREQKKSEAAAFFSRIEANLALAKAKKYPYMHIPGFKSTLTQEHFEKIYTKILNLSDQEKEDLERIPTGEYMYFKRDPNDASSRTFNIVRDEDGEFMLMIEPKSKRLDNTKRIIAYIGGAFKIRKIAVRADLPEAQPFASMVSYIKDTKADLVQFMDEVSVSQEFDKKPGFARTIFGHKQIKTKNNEKMIRVVTYSPYMPANLLDLVNKSWMPREIENLPYNQQTALYIDIIRQLIDIVQEIHNRGIQHKDLKLENFLIDYDTKSQRFVVQAIDFGLYQEISEKEQDKMQGTAWYFPPWLIQAWARGASILDLESFKAYAHSIDPREQDKFKDYKRYIKYRQTLAFYALMVNGTPDAAGNMRIPKMNFDAMSSGKHDVWSLGIMIYEILYGLESSSKDMHEAICNDKFLQTIFNFSKGNQPYDPARLYASIPDIDILKQNFERVFAKNLAELKNIKPVATTANAQDDEDNLSQYSASHSLDSNDQVAIRQQLVQVVKDFQVAINAIAADVSAHGSIKDVRIEDAVIDSILTMCPVAEKILQCKDALNFVLAPESAVFSMGQGERVYKLVHDCGDIFNAKTKVNLEQLLKDLLTVRKDITNIYQPNMQTKIEDNVWSDFASWKAFLDAMLIITYRKLESQQQDLDKRKSRSSVNFSRLFKKAPDTKSVEAKVRDYSHEVAECEREIDSLTHAMIEDLGEKGFKTSYAKKTDV